MHFTLPAARPRPILASGRALSLLLERKRNIEDPVRVNPAVPDAPNQIVLEPAGKDTDAQSRLCKLEQAVAPPYCHAQPTDAWPPLPRHSTP